MLDLEASFFLFGFSTEAVIKALSSGPLSSGGDVLHRVL